MNDQTPPRGLSWRGSTSESLAAILLLVGTAIPLCIRLGVAPPTIKAEIRCWKVVSGMNATGQWLVPYRDGGPALNKPPLFYWAGAAVGWLAGKASYGTLRAPSVIAALGLLALTWFWARSVAGPKTALAAAGILSLMWMYYHLGRDGSFEMMLAFFTNAALFAFDRTYWTGRRFLAPLIFLFLLAAFLTKGPPALMIVGVPIALFLVFRRELKRMATWPVALGVLVTLALGLAWFAVVLIRVPDAGHRFYKAAFLPVGAETVDHDARHYESPAYFLLRLPAILRFSALLLPLMIWRGWKTRFWREDPRLRYCAWIATGLLAVFSFFPMKQPHYMLPLFPVFAILMADAALWAADPQSRVHWAWLGVPAVLCAAGAVFAAAILGFYFHVLLGISVAKAIALPLALMALGGAGLWLAVRRKWTATGGAILMAAWLFFTAYFGSFEIVKHQFATGDIEKRADYDADHWLTMKQKYPYVAQTFRRGSRFDEDEVPSP